MPPAIQGSLTLTADDLAAGYRDLRGGAGQHWYLLLALVPMVWLPLTNSTSFAWYALLPLGIAALFLRQFSPQTMAKKHHARIKAEDLQLEFEFSDSGYRVRTGSSAFTQAYSSVMNYRDGKHTFMLFSPGQVAQLIPKRAFSEQEIQQITEWLGGAIQPRPRTTIIGSPKKAFLLWLVVVISLLAVWQLMTPR